MDEAALARFRNEVRVARQVSHPNVCRVYDIGFIEGFHFLSMEYLDGEDLASLLRRIGRLPPDKAIEFTRKICAGLAAAHERGVLHRDLKPANIMIDGRGQVRITDFGLAALAQEVPLGDIRSGTPAYMSPEQKAGKEVSTRSDLYSLGLVLYEMFTGKRRGDTQTNPTELVKDLDPAVERVILRCLEQDPKRRPSSALSVAMALPGGDPIAAALAAGETPSPEMVAASTEKEGFSPRTAWLLFAAIVIAVVLGAVFSAKASLLARVPIDLPPDALALKARELLKQFGYSETPVGKAYGFMCCNSGDLSVLEKLGPKRRDEILATRQPGIVSFWYRQHQDEFYPYQFVTADPFITTSVVTDYLPPNTQPGMIRMILGTDGRLQVLEALVKEASPDAAARTPASAAESLFAAAGLDYSRFKPSAPVRIPSVLFDTRMTWVGTYADDRPEQVTVQAAWWQGKPVYFHSNESPPEVQQSAGAWIQLGTFIVILVGAVSVARHNFRLGRGDRAGAARLAAFTFVLVMLSWLFTAHHVIAPFETLIIVAAISWAGFAAGAMWCLYMAIEPYTRRHWPDSLISWTRVQQGRFRNPLVASHALAGLAVVAWGMTLLWALRTMFSPIPYGLVISFLDNTGRAAGSLLFVAWANTFVTLSLLLLLMLARFVFRRAWIADTAVALLFSAASLGSVTNSHVAMLFAGCNAVLFLSYVWLFRRFGLLCMVMIFLVPLAQLPPPDWSAWYFGRALVGPLIPVAIAAWAVWVIVSSHRPASEAAG
jgi:serine/threonine-protein kinase